MQTELGAEKEAVEVQRLLRGRCENKYSQKMRNLISEIFDAGYLRVEHS